MSDLNRMNNKDINTLHFIYDRMKNRHSENENVDYMVLFKETIEKVKAQANEVEPSNSGLHLADVNASILAKAELINAVTNAMVANKQHLGTYHNIRDNGAAKLNALIESIEI